MSTLSTVTEVPESKITEFVETLRNFEKGDHPKRAYWDVFKDRFKIQDDPKINGTIVFHGCRCPKNTKFDEGLLPNHLAIDMLWDHIWQTCQDLFDAECLEVVRRNFENRKDAHYLGGYFDRLRGRRIRERGPWGKVVREEWFLEGSDSNHYLNGGPELIAVILNVFSNSVELRDRYAERTLPCIVHFLTDLCRADYLGYGIHFLRDSRFSEFYHDYHGYYGLTSMDGVTIPRGQILKIEFVNPDTLENVG